MSMCFNALTALGQLVIGACVLWVANQQHRTSRERLRFDLYEKDSAFTLNYVMPCGN